MSRSSELVCPSGLRVKLRSIKGKDLDGLRDKRRLATGEAISELLNNCSVEIIDRSIYEKLKQFDWADALVGDRMAALIALRMATNGDEYDFRVRCQDSECRQMINWSVNLNDLPRKDLPEESKVTFLDGNRFITDVYGERVTFKLTTGRDQVTLAKVAQQMKTPQRGQEKQARVLLGLAIRVVEVEGVDDIVGWLEELDLGDLQALIKRMDKADCGVETTISVECSGSNGCGLEQEVELPLDRTFFGMGT